MATLGVKPVEEDWLRADPSLEDDTISLRLAGTADARNSDVLQRLFRQVHAEAARLRVRRVAVDVRDLEFMAAACFKGLVTWLSDLQALEPGQQYGLSFVANPARSWQQRSLAALRCFAVDLVTIEMEPTE